MSAIKNLVNLEEIDRYEENVHAFLKGDLDGERFMAFRLQFGIYGQRQDGVHMVRIKAPGGRLNPDQLAMIADCAEEFGQNKLAHVTTRQDFQLHYVPTKDTPTVMRKLASAGLTTREACNNTIRNVTACPLAGVCPREHTDITTHMIGAVDRFLRYPLTQQMPRKFKISFSGCETDCAQGLMHDLAVVATHKDGRFGFKIMAAGGLGHKPYHALTVEEFVEEKDLLACMEAVITLHNKYSDRKRRARSRVKFLVDKFSPEGFLEKYREELVRTKAAYADYDYAKGQWARGAEHAETPFPGAPRRIIKQKQAGLHVFPIKLPIGDITPAQLRAVATVMKQEGLSDVRTTQDQSLMITGVREEIIPRLRAALATVGLSEPKPGDNVVACPGTSTCRLGITSSKSIGPKLSGGPLDLRIRASGCQNGCAQPETGDIGIYGEGKRLHGKLVPHYQMYFGGDGRSHGAIGIKGPSIPVVRIERAVERVQQTFAQDRSDGESFFHWSRRRGADYFGELLADLKTVSAEEVPSLLQDHGQAEQFRVLQLGGGECAGAAQSLVAANFAEAAHERNYRDAFRLQRQAEDAVECARQMLRLVGQSVLFLTGRQGVTELSDIARQLSEALPNTTLGARLAEFETGLAAQIEAFDDPALKTLSDQMDQWMLDAASVCQGIDKQLDLSDSLPPVKSPAKGNGSAPIDLTGYGCPLHYIKARNELRKFKGGDIVDFLFVSGDPSRQVSSSLASDGHEIISVQEQGTATRIKVRKARDAAVG
jgi:sulfite reductase beta subunit-like hemoprotein/TusA-related sulfurtransferase